MNVGQPNNRITQNYLTLIKYEQRIEEIRKKKRLRRHHPSFLLHSTAR